MAQSYLFPLVIHEELRKELSQERASKIAELLEKSISYLFKSAEDIAVQKKLELRDELSKELASKADVALVKADIALVKAELLSEIQKVESKLDKKMAIWSITILFAIILTNKDSLTFIAQLLGLIK